MLALAGVDIKSMNLANAAATPAAPSPAGQPKWPSETYRRFSTDMHVPDWDPATSGAL